MLRRERPLDPDQAVDMIDAVQLAAHRKVRWQRVVSKGAERVAFIKRNEAHQGFKRRCR
jgi:hypothetical protein